MSKVFIDTNIILDVILGREKFVLESSNILALQIFGKAELYATALTFANALYICRKLIGKEESIEKLSNVFEKIHVSPLGQKEYNAAMQMSHKDIEDNFQFCSAVSANCDVIVTRNIKDFPSHEKIKVMLPSDFLNSMSTND